MATTVSNQQIPRYMQDLLTREGTGLFPQLSDALDANYQPYQGPRVAGFSQDQLEAFDRVRSMTGATDPAEINARGLLDQAQQSLTEGTGRTQEMIDQSVGQGQDWLMNALGRTEQLADQGNPLMGQAQQLVEQSAQGPTSEGLEQYMNPFQESVIDTTMSELQRQDDIARQGRSAQAAGAGAFGGSRHGVMEAEAGRNLSDTMARTLAQLNSQNFGQAMDTFQNQQQLQGQAGSQLGSLGANQAQLQQAGVGQMMQGGGALSDLFGSAAGQQAGLTGQRASGFGDLARQELGLGSFGREMDISDINNLARMGGMQQQQLQAGLDTAYQDFLQERQYEDPRQKVAFMSDIIRGAPSGSQTISRTYQDPQSPMQMIAGLAPLAAAFI